MIDRLSPEQRTHLMRKVKGKDTGPEKLVRSVLHRLGYRFRLHRKDLPGTPDLVLPKHRAVIFVHGCFWHGHGCRIGKLPKSRLDYWEPKIEANRKRDARKQEQLLEQGWRIGVVWQCELRNLPELEKRLSAFLNQ